MSLIGKKPIIMPDKVEAEINDGVFSVKGPLGELKRQFKNDIAILIKEKNIILNPAKESKNISMLWGTYASHIKNMLEGVTKGFEKKLVVEGVGYKAQIEGQKIVFGLGFSHPVEIDIPKSLKVSVEKNNIKIFGIDKEEVGSFGAKIRAFKKPEPYKGKGIRYENEIIRRKSGKKAATSVQ